MSERRTLKTRELVVPFPSEEEPKSRRSSKDKIYRKYRSEYNLENSSDSKIGSKSMGNLKERTKPTSRVQRTSSPRERERRKSRNRSASPSDMLALKPRRRTTTHKKKVDNSDRSPSSNHSDEKMSNGGNNSSNIMQTSNQQDESEPVTFSHPALQESFEPRRIKKTEGDRIRLVLGETSETFVLILDQDDGDTIWQTVRWGGRGIPAGLVTQLLHILQEGLYISQLAFASDDRWFIQCKSAHGGGSSSSRKKSKSRQSTAGLENSSTDSDPSFHHNSSSHTESWWGGCCKKANKALESWTKAPHPLQVSFGENGQCFLLQGLNGHWDVGLSKVEIGLRNRVEKRYKDGGKVDFVRLFPFHSCPNSYVVSDSEGTKWYGLNENLAKELRESAIEYRVCDVCMTAATLNQHGEFDPVEEWAVFYPRHYKISENLAPSLATEIAHFYRVEKARRLRRDAAIEKYHSKFSNLEKTLQQDTGDLEKELTSLQKQREDDLGQILTLKSSLHEEKEKNEQLQESNKLKALSPSPPSTELVVPHQLPSIGFQKDQRVTVANHSANKGDAVITDIQANSNTCTVKMDYGDIVQSIPLYTLSPYDTAAELREIRIDISKMEKQYWRKRVQLNASTGKYFLWRGLRSDECEEEGTSLMSKEPKCVATLEASILNASNESQYLHLTTCPKIAMYYALHRDAKRIRIAQIDYSLLATSDIIDVSTPEGCQHHGINHPHAESFATANHLVTVRGSIPPHAMIIHDLPVPSNIQSPTGSMSTYMKHFPDALTKMVQSWERDVLEFILEQECDLLGTANNDYWVYPSHIIALASYLGSLITEHNREEEEDDHALWKTILRRKVPDHLSKEQNNTIPRHLQVYRSGNRKN